MSSANNEFYIFLSNFDAFISSSFLFAVARNSSTMLNKSAESRHHFLVPDLKGNALSFYSSSMMLAVGLSYMAFITLRYVPSIPTLLRVFTINGGWISSNASSALIDMIMWFLSFNLFIW